jgi:hypothetical protein
VDAAKKGYWTADDVRSAQKACADAGLNLEAMMLLLEFYRHALLGRPGRVSRDTLFVTVVDGLN